MSTGTSSELSESKNRVVAIRQRAREAYQTGTPAMQVVARMAHETETVIVDFFRDMLETLAPAERKLVEQNTAVVKMGGFGRGELAPFSDVDLLFLHRGTINETLTGALGCVVRDCWDAGIKLGHTVQTMRDAVRLAKTDITFATAAIEAELLCGDAQLLNNFKLLFRRKIVDRNFTTFIEECLTTRKIERKQYGATVSQVQPNIKRSPGGLRDLHLIRWICFAEFQTPEIDELHRVWALSEKDVQALKAAREFLTHLRCDLHFAAGGPQDVLTREEQLRISAERKYLAPPGQQPVERFMQEYFHHAAAIEDISERLTAREIPQAIGARIVQRILPSKTEDIFTLDANQVDVQAEHHDQLCGDLDSQMRLFSLSAEHGIPPAPQLLREISQAPRSDPPPVSPAAARDFLSILGRAEGAGRTLRMMYKAGVLEKIIPEMSQARGLLEFNEYHQFTVDEHSLRAVEAPESFADSSSLLGQVYREIKRKELLHLALLIHDLGKGYEEDHSQVGGEIAGAVAERLGLESAQRDILVLLVEKHLVMSHLAFRRDISDMDLVLTFTRDVGSLDQLRKLYVLTAADIVAVGPGTWTEWKGELLSELYERSMMLLSGISHTHQTIDRDEQLRERVISHVASSPELLKIYPKNGWLAETLATLPEHYLTSTPTEQTAADLAAVAQLPPNDSLVRWRHEPATDTIRYRIVTHEGVAKGCFSKMAGVIAAMRLEIVSADICTSSQGIVIDKFRVVDLEHPEGTPEIRLDEIKQIIRDVLAGKRTVKSLFTRRGRADDSGIFAPARPPRIVIDNSSSEKCTIIDIFARNRPGLLYVITDALFDLDLSVQLAKISTYGDSVVDVFYVTNGEGQKIVDADRVRAITDAIRKQVESLDQFGLDAILA